VARGRVLALATGHRQRHRRPHLRRRHAAGTDLRRHQPVHLWGRNDQYGQPRLQSFNTGGISQVYAERAGALYLWVPITLSRSLTWCFVLHQ